MARLIFIYIFVLASTLNATTLIRELHSKKLFGPEVFSFCGGYIEVWLTRESKTWNQLYIKATPPVDKEWEISNGNIIVELDSKRDEPIRFSDIRTLKVQRGEVNTKVWTFNLEQYYSKIKVALLPLSKNCEGQKSYGVVLSEQDLTTY